MSTDNSLLTAALDYAARGWHVFPCWWTNDDGTCACGHLDCKNAGKHPLAKATPNGLHNATNDRATLSEWWTKFPRANVAIRTGVESGIIVIDGDIYKADSDSLSDLHLSPTRLHRTPRGGWHYVYQHPGGKVPSGTNVLGQGIDIRGDGGYVVAPPSRINSAAYSHVLASGADPQSLPDHILQRLASRKRPKSPEQDTAEARLPGAEMRKIRGALNYIDADPRDNWFRVAMSLKSTGGGSQARGLWDEWSQRSDKYDPVEQSHTWNSREVEGGITLGTLFELAKQGGWISPEPERPPIDAYENDPEAGGDDTLWSQTRSEETTPQTRATRLLSHKSLWSHLRKFAFSGLAGEFVKLMRPHSEACDEALLLTFLGEAGCLIGRTTYFQVEGDRHYPNLFIALVGITAVSRKGTSQGRVRQVIEVIDTQWWEDNVTSSLGSGEAVVWAVRDKVTRREKVKGKYQDVEADQGVSDKRLLVLEEEFSMVLKVAGREGNVLSDILRKAWDGKVLRNTVKGSPVKATGAHVAVIGHITQTELLRHLTDTEMANGFGNRYLWCSVGSDKSIPISTQPDNEAVISLRKKLVDQLEARHKWSQERRFTEEAEALWCYVYPALRSPGEGLCGALLARGAPQVLRLAIIYSVLDGAKDIEGRHLLAALVVWDYCEASVRHIFGERVGSAIADSILWELEDRSEMSRTDIRNLFGRHNTKASIDAALAELLQAGAVTVKTAETKGRSRKIISLVRDRSDQSDKRPVATLVEAYLQKQKCDQRVGDVNFDEFADEDAAERRSGSEGGEAPDREPGCDDDPGPWDDQAPPWEGDDDAPDQPVSPAESGYLSAREQDSLKGITRGVRVMDDLPTVEQMPPGTETPKPTAATVDEETALVEGKPDLPMPLAPSGVPLEGEVLGRESSRRTHLKAIAAGAERLKHTAGCGLCHQGLPCPEGQALRAVETRWRQEAERRDREAARRDPQALAHHRRSCPRCEAGLRCQDLEKLMPCEPPLDEDPNAGHEEKSTATDPVDKNAQPVGADAVDKNAHARGRPRLGEQPLTKTERQQRWRLRRKAETREG